MAKEHHFSFDLSKKDLIIIRSYIYNLFEDNFDKLCYTDDFKFIFDCLPQDVIDEIEYMLDKHKKNKNMHTSNHRYVRRKFIKKNEYKNIVDKFINANEKEYTSVFGYIKSFLEKVHSKTDLIHPKVKKLSQIYSLDLIEQKIVTALYYIQLLDCDFSIKIQNLICIFTGISNRDLKKHASKKSNLVIYKITKDRDLDSLNDAVIQYLSSDKNVSFLDFFCTQEYSEYDIGSYFLSKSKMETARSIIKNVPDAKILLYGSSGTGKTSFAKSLAKSCNKIPYSLENNDALWLVSHSLADNELLIIDEADNLFNEGIFDYMRDDKKSDLNKLLDSINSQCIFLVNTIQYVNKAVLRRFNYVIEFRELSVAENELIWRININNIGKILSDKEITEYAHKYPLPIGITSLAVNTSLKASKNKKKRKEIFEEIMKSHNFIRNGHNRQLQPKVNFETSFLNTDIPFNTIKSYIDMYTKMDNKDIRCGLLFHGVPGTGKTEFARYLADLSGYEHFTVRSSDFLSPYVGGTEQNIAEIFQKAQEKHTVLIFDEADSLLMNRRDAYRSWEVTRVNEFLSQLDNFNGIFIATTNFMQNFDIAAMRRFDWKVEFKSIENNKIYYAFCYFFPHIDFSEFENKIRSLTNITAGDIAVLVSKFKFSTEINAKNILEQAEIELKYKENHIQKSIGF